MTPPGQIDRADGWMWDARRRQWVLYQVVSAPRPGEPIPGEYASWRRGVMVKG